MADHVLCSTTWVMTFPGPFLTWQMLGTGFKRCLICLNQSLLGLFGWKGWLLWGDVCHICKLKSVWQEEAQSHLHPEDLATQADHSSSASTSQEVDTSSEASSGRSRRSFMGLSDKELLKCAFPHPQAEGDAESLGSHGQHLRPLGPDQTCLIYYQDDVCSVLADDLDSDGPNALRYVPGKARSHHLEMMLSKEELEEEQRSVRSTQITAWWRGYHFIVKVPALSRQPC